MIVKLQCPACAARCSGDIPEGRTQVKCPKCSAPIPIPPPAPPEEEEPLEGEILEDEDEETEAPEPEIPTIDPEVEVEPVKRKKRAWELLKPRTFGLTPKSIMGGLVYDLFDAETDEILGRATEEVDAGKAVIGFLTHRSLMAGTIVVKDDYTGKPVLIIERSKVGMLGAKPVKVKLYDHRDELLAKMEIGKPMWGGLALDIDVDCTVVDGSKKEWAVAVGKKVREPDYVFLDEDEKKLARVRGKGKTQGFMAAASSWTGKGGWLKISIAEEFDATPVEKLMILGTVIAIEFIITQNTETKPGTIRLG